MALLQIMENLQSGPNWSSPQGPGGSRRLRKVGGPQPRQCAAAPKPGAAGRLRGGAMFSSLFFLPSTDPTGSSDSFQDLDAQPGKWVLGPHGLEGKQMTNRLSLRCLLRGPQDPSPRLSSQGAGSDGLPAGNSSALAPPEEGPGPRPPVMAGSLALSNQEYDSRHLGPARLQVKVPAPGSHEQLLPSGRTIKDKSLGTLQKGH